MVSYYYLLVCPCNRTENIITKRVRIDEDCHGGRSKSENGSCAGDSLTLPTGGNGTVKPRYLSLQASNSKFTRGPESCAPRLRVTDRATRCGLLRALRQKYGNTRRSQEILYSWRQSVIGCWVTTPSPTITGRAITKKKSIAEAVDSTILRRCYIFVKYAQLPRWPARSCHRFPAFFNVANPKRNPTNANNSSPPTPPSEGNILNGWDRGGARAMQRI